MLRMTQDGRKGLPLRKRPLVVVVAASGLEDCWPTLLMLDAARLPPQPVTLPSNPNPNANADDPSSPPPPPPSSSGFDLVVIHPADDRSNLLPKNSNTSNPVTTRRG